MTPKDPRPQVETTRAQAPNAETPGDETPPSTAAKHWRNFVIVAVAATLCLGGSFTCNTDNDSDNEINGHVTVNAVLP